MKKKKTEPAPLTPADLAHIIALSEQHSEGLRERCERYRMRMARRHAVVALCLTLVVVVNAQYGLLSAKEVSASSGVDFYTTAGINRAVACVMVNNILYPHAETTRA